MDKVSLIKYNTYNPSFGGLNSKKSAKIIGAAKSLIPKQDNGKIFGQESAWRLHEEDAFREFVNEDEAVGCVVLTHQIFIGAVKTTPYY